MTPVRQENVLALMGSPYSLTNNQSALYLGKPYYFHSIYFGIPNYQESWNGKILK